MQGAPLMDTSSQRYSIHKKMKTRSLHVADGLRWPVMSYIKSTCTILLATYTLYINKNCATPIYTGTCTSLPEMKKAVVVSKLNITRTLNIAFSTKSTQQISWTHQKTNITKNVEVLDRVIDTNPHSKSTVLVTPTLAEYCHSILPVLV